MVFRVHIPIAGETPPGPERRVTDAQRAQASGRKEVRAVVTWRDRQRFILSSQQAWTIIGQ